MDFFLLVYKDKFKGVGPFEDHLYTSMLKEGRKGT